MIFSGYSIKEEMCVNYVYYYPKINLELCKSSIDTKALDAYFRYGNWIPSSSYGYSLADPTDQPKQTDNLVCGLSKPSQQWQKKGYKMS